MLANRIGLLMQACDATAGLIGNALITAFVAGDGDSVTSRLRIELLAETIDADPPVLRTRRLRPDGEAITLDISGCTFGAGRRPCPGADQAMALAAGVLDAILPACELADQQIDYVPSPNLRIPAQLLIYYRLNTSRPKASTAGWVASPSSFRPKIRSTVLSRE